jgi:chromosomal replication initiation ATPase DnaA
MNAPFSVDRPDLLHRAVVEVLTGVFPTIREDTLLSSEKLNHTTSWVRQVGMYLMASRLQAGQTPTARHFGRDRTTVSHACQLCVIEAAERPSTAAFFDFLEREALAALDRFARQEQEWGVV